MICTFLGHRDAPISLQTSLENTVEKMIKEGFDTFYFGHNGAFDGMAKAAVLSCRRRHPHIRAVCVLAYLPVAPHDVEPLYPAGLEYVPRRFAISHRNRWMVQQADAVISYTVLSSGGAAQFTAYAQKRGKRIIRFPM